MRCLLCTNLELALEARRNDFIQATTIAYFSVSRKSAAYMKVEMERALIELQDHRSVCPVARNEMNSLPGSGKTVAKEALKTGAVGAAA
jgi:hypothetical protein